MGFFFPPRQQTLNSGAPERLLFSDEINGLRSRVPKNTKQTKKQHCTSCPPLAFGVLSLPPPHPSLASSLHLAVGRQTTAPASVSAVAGTTAGIVEQGRTPPAPTPHICHSHSVRPSLYPPPPLKPTPLQSGSITLSCRPSACC